MEVKQVLNGDSTVCQFGDESSVKQISGGWVESLELFKETLLSLSLTSPCSLHLLHVLLEVLDLSSLGLL